MNLEIELLTNDVILLETQEEFFQKCGVRFEIDYHIHNTPAGISSGAYLRKHVPRDVAVLTNYVEDDGRMFFDVYLVYCRRGRVYVYKAF